jgi:hypothetical protein
VSLGQRRDFGLSEAQQRILNPTTSYPTFNVKDLVLVEDVLLDSSYVPVLIGTPRKGATNYKLVSQKEVVNDGDKQYVRRVWATKQQAQEQHNLALKYLSGAATAATYIRRYTILKSEYSALTVGTPLTAVASIALTAGGIGYTSAPAVTISGTGTGATAIAQIRDGAVVAVLITAEGSGYTTTPTVAFSGGGGTGATATASVQDQNALLVEQQAAPEQGEMGNMFYEVTRVWQVLPGPAITSKRLDPDGVTVTTTRTRKLISAITPSESITYDGGYGATAHIGAIGNNGSVVQIIADVGGSGYLTPPVVEFSGDGLGCNAEAQLTAGAVSGFVIHAGGGGYLDGSLAATVTLTSATLWTRTTMEPDDSTVFATEVVETRTLPGLPVVTEETDEDGVVAKVRRTLKERAKITPGESITDGVWRRVSIEPVTETVAHEVIRTRALPGNPVPFQRTDTDGKVITITRTLKAAADITAEEDVTAGIWTRTRAEPVTELVAHEVIESRAVPGDEVVTVRTDNDANLVRIGTVLLESALSASETISGSDWVKVRTEPVTRKVAHQITEIISIPSRLVYSSRTDEDGVVVQVTRQIKDTTTITASESIATGVWTRVRREPISAVVSHEVTESRPVPGNAVPSSRIGEGGETITISRVLKDTTTITPTESESGGTWTKVTRDAVTDLVAHEVTETRAVPTPWVTKTEIDSDGFVVTRKTRHRKASDITDGETLSAGVWTKTTKQGNGVVAMEVVETRAIPGASLTYRIYDAQTDTTVIETRQLIDASTAALTLTNPLTDYRDVPHNSALVMMRIIREYPSGITGKTLINYKMARFQYPALLDYTPGDLQAGTLLNGQKIFLVNLKIEDAREREVPWKYTTTFTTSQPVNSTIESGVVNFQTKRSNYQGALFSVHTGPVLEDAGNIVATTGTGDPVWGSGVVETYTFAASSPTRTDYVNSRTAGDWFVYTRVAERIAHSLWRVTQIELPYR